MEHANAQRSTPQHVDVLLTGFCRTQPGFRRQHYRHTQLDTPNDSSRRYILSSHRVTLAGVSFTE